MRKCRAETIFEAIMAENVPKWMTDTKLQMQGALKTQSRGKKWREKRKNMTTINPRHIHSTVGSHSQEILNTASENP